MSRDAVSPWQRGKAKTEEIVYSTIVHERDRNPVFAEQFTLYERYQQLVHRH